jgi:hypothetical protein
MSNPFQTIRETMQTHLVAGVTAAKWVDVYDGEDWKDEDFGQMRSRISAKGAGIYVRVVRTERDAEAPDSFDHHRLYLHVICAAAAVADRKRSAEAAEDLVWQAYQTVRAAGQSPTWLHEPWRLQGFTPEYQGANATIVSLLFASSADLAELETATYEPNAEVPDTGVSTIADQDRLSLWVQADGWVRRFITGANLQAQFAGGGGGGSTDVAAATHAAQAKSPLADNDEIPVADSAAAYGLKKVLWSVIKGTFALLAHGHTGTTDGSKLAQANTHESADTDNATTALHHTLGTAANQAAAGNDSRLSDPRTPVAHNQSWSTITDKPTTFAPVIGAGAGDAVAGNDARLTDPRTPVAHNQSWSTITDKPTTFAPVIGAGAGDAVAGNDSRLTDDRAPTAAGMAAKLHAAAAKTPLADNDEIPIADSAATYGLKKVLWSVIKGTFALLAHGHTGTTDGSKLAQANTHESADTDNATTALHHTLGTAANQAAAGNDSRLSDPRTPVAHNQSWSTITDKPTTFAPVIGAGAGDAVAGNDARLTDDRAPTAAGMAAKLHAAAAKTPLADNDEIPIADSAATYGLKKVLWSVIKGTFALLAHGHTGTTDGSKLAQANTHESADTDNATTALHHTLGTAANQAAAGNHTHAGGGASRWTEIAAAHYTATPASTSTLTFGTDDTATLIVGLPVRYTIGGTVYYGQVTAIAANLLTVRGAPMGGDVTKLEVGTAEMVSQIHVQLPGLFEDASNATLLATDLYTKLYWERALSYCVGYSANVMTADGGANQANVQVYWGTNLVSTANTNTGPLVTVAKVATVVDINTTNYVVSTGELLEIGCTKGSTGDARDLTVEIVMVTP